MRPVLSKRVVKDLRTVIQYAWDRDILTDEGRDGLLAAISPGTKRSVKASRTRRVARKKTRKDEWAEVRAAVLQRAGDGTCENRRCGRVVMGGQGEPQLECDHFLGGGGRRVSLESEFTVWALCHTCHKHKTRNWPSAAFWLDLFIEHCEWRARGEHDDCAKCNGFKHAASIAQARLDAMALQGRTGEQT